MEVICVRSFLFGNVQDLDEKSIDGHRKFPREKLQ